jgi:hypothetical protein
MGREPVRRFDLEGSPTRRDGPPHEAPLKLREGGKGLIWETPSARRLVTVRQRVRTRVRRAQLRPAPLIVRRALAYPGDDQSDVRGGHLSTGRHLRNTAARPEQSLDEMAARGSSRLDEIAMVAARRGCLVHERRVTPRAMTNLARARNERGDVTRVGYGSSSGATEWVGSSVRVDQRETRAAAARRRIAREERHESTRAVAAGVRPWTLRRFATRDQTRDPG